MGHLINATDTAERLDIKETTLTNWRYRGIGPRYYKLGGAVKYDTDDLDAWVKSQRVETSDRPADATV